MLRFSHDERQSCNILRESQHLSPSDTVGEGPGWWFGGNGDRIVSISAESGAHGKEDPNNFSTAAAATSPSLEEEWLRFLQFRRWGRFGSVDFNLAWELKRLRQLGGGGKKGTAVQDTVRYEKRLLATLKRHKESLSAQQFNAHCKQYAVIMWQLFACLCLIRLPRSNMPEIGLCIHRCENKWQGG